MIYFIKRLLHFKTIMHIIVTQISNLRKSFTFEIIISEPSAPFSSAIHTISLKKITMSNSTYVEWVTDFSNDATSTVVMDSSFKHREAFVDLSRVFA